MAIFQVAHNEVMANEGGYNNDPADSGGETYKGISRVHWPDWDGWRYVDGVKCRITPQPHYGTSAYTNWARYLDSKLASLYSLQQMVLEFYRSRFWKRLAEIDSQDVATWVYDKDVNTGSLGSRWLQAAANVPEDGIIGTKTIRAVNNLDPAPLLDRMKDLATAFYLHEAQKPGKSRYWHGWDSAGRPVLRSPHTSQFSSPRIWRDHVRSIMDRHFMSLVIVGVILIGLGSIAAAIFAVKDPTISVACITLGSNALGILGGVLAAPKILSRLNNPIVPNGEEMEKV